MTIIECTTGNAGIACAAVAAIKGYACVIVMPEGMSEERKKMIHGYGAELVLTPGAGTDIDLAMARMREMVAAEPGRVTSSRRSSRTPTTLRRNARPARRSGSRRAARWMRSSRRRGPAGGSAAWRSALKAHDPAVRAYAAEPAECPLISEQRWGTHGVPGIGDGIIPRNLDLSLMDGIVTSSTSEALDMARAPRARGGDALRPVVGHERGVGVEGGGQASGVPPDRDRRSPIRGSATSPASCSANVPTWTSPTATTRSTPTTLERVAAHRDRLEFIS